LFHGGKLLEETDILGGPVSQYVWMHLEIGFGIQYSDHPVVVIDGNRRMKKFIRG